MCATPSTIFCLAIALRSTPPATEAPGPITFGAAMAALLALVSACSWGTGDFLGGLASRRGGKPAVVIMWGSPLALLILLVLAVGLPGSHFQTVDMLWGLAAGLVGTFALSAFYRSLAIGPMTVAAPLSSVTNALIPFAFGLAAGEALGPVGAVGVLLALASVVAVGIDPDPEHGDVGDARRSAPWAVLAGVGFGLFFVLIDHTSSSAGLWPLVAVKLAAGVAQFVIASRARLPLVLPSSLRGLAIGSGLFDAAANGLFLAATHRGALSEVAILASLYPAATVVWARFVLNERLGTTRIVGLLSALGAAALLGLG